MILLNVCIMPIRWTDLDAYGHLNHAVFFNFMSEARVELFKSIINKEDLCQFVTAHVECDYKIPYYHPDSIILKQYRHEISSASFNLSYDFFSEKNPDVLHAHAKVKMVAFNPKSGRPTRLTPEVLALLKIE